MTRFNIAALQDQGMTPDQISSYIREQEAAIYGGPRGPKGGGGAVTPTSLVTPRPVPEPYKGDSVKGDFVKGGTGYDIMAPMPGPAITSPGGTRSDLGKPGLADLGKPGADIMPPRPPRPVKEATGPGPYSDDGTFTFPGAGVDETPESSETVEEDTPRRSKKKEKFQKLLEKKKARRKANRMERKQDRREARIEAKRERLADKPRRLAKFEEMLRSLQGS